jgi:hypothetical protein
MLSAKDWLSFLIGAIVAAFGLLPILNRLNIGPSWFALEFLPIALFGYIVAAAGFYLMIESVIEITNSNAVGWISFLVAVVVLVIGILPTLARFGIGPGWFAFTWLSPLIYQIIFIVEGLFLMIAMFAMEM